MPIYNLILVWLFISLSVYGCGSPPVQDSATAAAAAPQVTIGAFNMLHLGRSDQQEKNLSRMVSLIAEADYDAFVGLEIMTEEGAQELLAVMQEEDSPKWELLLSKT